MSSLRLGDTVPDFVQESTEGTIRFHEWAGNSWVVLFSHPADFTPVCTTELGKTAALSGEFARRGVKPIAVSVDPLESHKSWVNDINETQNTTVNLPILADADKKVATLYDMIHPNSLVNATVRSVFIVVQAGDRTVGLLVDAVSDILSITDDLVLPTPDVACETVRSFVRGIISIEERMISEISLDRILPEREALAA